MCDFQSDLLLWSRWGFEHVWNLMQTAVCYANNMGGSKSPERKAITKQIWTYCISHNHWLSATLSRARSTPEVEYCVQWRETVINSAENICLAKKPILQRANRHRLTLFHFRSSLTVLKRFLKTNRHKYVTAMSYFTITVIIVTITNSRIWLAITSYYFFSQTGQCYWTVRAIACALHEHSCTFIFSLLRISGWKVFFFPEKLFFDFSPEFCYIYD